MRTVAGLQCLPEGQSEDIFGALTVIAKILETSSPGSSWVEKTGALVGQAIAELPGRSVRELGFPDNWRTLEIWNT
jgi:hypothetical protein